MEGLRAGSSRWQQLIWCDYKQPQALNAIMEVHSWHVHIQKIGTLETYFARYNLCTSTCTVLALRNRAPSQWLLVWSCSSAPFCIEFQKSMCLFNWFRCFRRSFFEFLFTCVYCYHENSSFHCFIVDVETCGNRFFWDAYVMHFILLLYVNFWYDLWTRYKWCCFKTYASCGMAVASEIVFS